MNKVIHAAICSPFSPVPNPYGDAPTECQLSQGREAARKVADSVHNLTALYDGAAPLNAKVGPFAEFGLASQPTGASAVWQAFPETGQ